MNSTTTRSIVTAVITVALCWTPVAAVASPPRGPEAPRPAIAMSPFAEAVGTLGGRALAQYLAEHMERNLG